jgi:hypothetical protein
MRKTASAMRLASRSDGSWGGRIGSVRPDVATRGSVFPAAVQRGPPPQGQDGSRWMTGGARPTAR